MVMINLELIRKEKPIKELLNFSIINIDKPTGPTSFTVSHFIMHALQLNKTSHFGTLDPMVTGVLPIALGRACRLNEYFMHRNKTYVGIMRLHKEINQKELDETIKKFIGKINQLPPVKSRVKRAIREREIFSFNIIEVDGKDVLFETEVQAGTYIRKLCDDMGKEIGGAHMLELRRTKAGLFDESNAITLYEFEKALIEYGKGNDLSLRSILTPAEIITELLPSIEVKQDAVKKLLTGKPLFSNDLQGKFNLEEGDKFIVMHKDRIIGFYSVKEEGDIIAKPEFVLN
ncbi:MAG: RNA-guided pseudouridylation complex pseudouridine synthase subunit Cbf5 [archaeon]